jgi:hypothetical protein
MSWLLLTDTDVVKWTLVPLCIQVILVSLECLYNRALYRPANFLDWGHVQALRGVSARVLKRQPVSRFFFDYPNVLGLFGARMLLAAGVLLMTLRGEFFLWAILPLWIMGLSATIRNGYSENGSDQMSNIVLTSVSLYFVFSASSFIQAISIFFIASQGMLAYLTAGFFKAININWLNGTYLKELLHTKAFSNQVIANVFDRWKNSYKVASIALISWEVIMGFCFLMPPPICLGILAGGVLFHLGVAFIMGFNTFFWAFLALYPSIYFVSIKIH